GDKPIKDVKQGDLVLASPDWLPNGPVEAKEVEEVFVSEARVLNLHVRGRTIRTTPMHPFYVLGAGWVPCWLLREGDLLRSDDGQWVPVDGLSDSGETTTVYNLRIADYHTYYVGSHEWGFSLWAHNMYELTTAARRAAADELEGLGDGRWSAELGQALRVLDPARPSTSREAATRLLASLVRKGVDHTSKTVEAVVESLGKATSGDVRVARILAAWKKQQSAALEAVAASGSTYEEQSAWFALQARGK